MEKEWAFPLHLGELKDKLKELCDKHGISMNEFVVRAVRREMERIKDAKPII